MILINSLFIFLFIFNKVSGVFIGPFITGLDKNNACNVYPSPPRHHDDDDDDDDDVTPTKPLTSS